LEAVVLPFKGERSSWLQSVMLGSPVRSGAQCGVDRLRE